MTEDRKKIKSLVSGLLSNNEAKTIQSVNELVESIMLEKKDFLTEVLRKKVQGEL